MNNKYFASLLCITILALVPACAKRHKKKTTHQEDVKTKIELDNTIFEIEENDDTHKSITKF